MYMDDIGYQLNDKDIQAIVRWLKVNDPKNANPEFAKQMLIKMRSDIREIGRFSEDLLHKIKEEIDKDQKGKTSEE